jgi:hypothetical protein
LYSSNLFFFVIMLDVTRKKAVIVDFVRVLLIIMVQYIFPSMASAQWAGGGKNSVEAPMDFRVNLGTSAVVQDVEFETMQAVVLGLEWCGVPHFKFGSSYHHYLPSQRISSHVGTYRWTEPTNFDLGVYGHFFPFGRFSQRGSTKYIGLETRYGRRKGAASLYGLFSSSDLVYQRRAGMLLAQYGTLYVIGPMSLDLSIGVGGVIHKGMDYNPGSVVGVVVPGFWQFALNLQAKAGIGRVTKNKH